MRYSKGKSRGRKSYGRKSRGRKRGKAKPQRTYKMTRGGIKL